MEAKGAHSRASGFFFHAPGDRDILREAGEARRKA